ncbi:hypothetical protein RHGRI_031225 [Rhododendron griersonianum]|uniref:F-box/kelch-repeat protein n=1 Tax=Rhododendron griersonianum TaxID=479676 RepID=A0AAV6IAB3_9ERIC|nr:hypothetical protein RHGRI_031225 [Rhododendron griersonianum]
MWALGRMRSPITPRNGICSKSPVKNDKEKEAEEKLAKKVCQITDAELRGAYLAFHHDNRHQGELDRVPILSLVVKLKLGKSFRFYGTSSASVGSFVFASGDIVVSRGLNGNLYVMGFDGGGTSLDVPSVWGEFLDTRLVGEGHVEWSALPDPPSTLGSKCLFAAALDRDFSGKILVLNLYTYAMCLYDVTEKSWESLDPIVEYYSGLTGPLVVVGRNLYWIRGLNVWVYDLLKKALVSLPIGDSKICWLIKDSYREMRPTLVHLTGDLFCLIWISEDCESVYCMKV